MSQILNLSLSQKSGTGIKHLAGLILSLSLTTREISQIGIFLSQKKLRAKQQFLFFDKCTIAISLALALTNGGSWQIVICSSGTKRKWCCWWPTPKLRQNAINVSINPGPIFHVFYRQARALSFSSGFSGWEISDERGNPGNKSPSRDPPRKKQRAKLNLLLLLILPYRARSWKIPEK